MSTAVMLTRTMGFFEELSTDSYLHNCIWLSSIGCNGFLFCTGLHVLGENDWVFTLLSILAGMHGRKACQLVKETATGEKGQMKPFNVSIDMCRFHLCFREIHAYSVLAVCSCWLCLCL